MKKLFTMLGMAALSAVAMSQRVTTHSIYDVDQNGSISVTDAATVVDNVVRNMAPAQTPQYATAEELNEVLSNIYKLLENLDQKLNYVMKESGISIPIEPDENGIYSNGHDYVDLGMKDSQGHTVYWATCNIGAETPEDYGLYFAWGDTEGHSSNGTNDTQPDGYYYNWSTVPFNNGSSGYDEAYFYSVKDEVCPGGVLAPEYDAAHVKWQGDWRMPTYGELYWLRNSDNCTWTWDSTKKGYTVTSKTTGASIFLPSAGYRYDSYLYRAGSYGYFWSSSLYSDVSLYAYYLNFNSSTRRVDVLYRYYGRSVRPVCVFSE